MSNLNQRSMALPRLLVAAAVTLLWVSPQIAQASYIFVGITFYDPQLLSIDPVTGQIQPGPALDPTTLPFGLAWYQDKLYTYTPGSAYLQLLDPSNGGEAVPDPAFPVPGSPIFGEGDLAFLPDGTYFISQSLGSQEGFLLHRFTPENQGVWVSYWLDGGWDGLAYDPLSQGVLYGLQQHVPKLYRFDTATGQRTLVGTLKSSGSVLVSTSFLGALAFAPTGELFAVMDGGLYQVNKETAEATLILDTGYKHISGLAAATLPVPEPGTFLLLATGIALGACRRLRRVRL